MKAVKKKKVNYDTLSQVDKLSYIRNLIVEEKTLNGADDILSKLYQIYREMGYHQGVSNGRDQIRSEIKELLNIKEESDGY